MDAKIKIEMVTESSKKPIELDYTSVTEIRITVGDTAAFIIKGIDDETMQALRITSEHGPLNNVKEDADEVLLFTQRK